MALSNLSINTDSYLYPEGLTADEAVSYPDSATTNETDTFNEIWTIPQQQRRINRIVLTLPSNYPDWIFNIERKINHLLTLKNNWDAYGAKEVSSDPAKWTFKLLFELFHKEIPEPSVVPTSIGGIQIEWHMKNVDFEIEIQPEGCIDVFMEDLLNEFEEKDFELNKLEISTNIEFNSAIDLFMEKINQR